MVVIFKQDKADPDDIIGTSNETSVPLRKFEQNF